uniref:Uncharacterized protein n=1 Tax=Kalanchoe fedtschenkoi TaxID=63787 RepID=A0A7N0SZ16_KALFE
MASSSSMAYSSSINFSCYQNHLHFRNSSRRVFLCRSEPEQNENHPPNGKIGRRELVLKSSEIAVIGAILNLSGKKPDYLGVQKNYPALALCPATKNCISTSEDVSDLTHYLPPWTYNPEEGRGSKKPVTREEAMEELLQVIKTTKADRSIPQIVEKTEDYIRVEYESPIFGLVDDVEFWFPPGKDSIVEYRSASRTGIMDFDANRKRIKVSSVSNFHYR